MNAENEGNELRFMNDFHNIADSNNVSMRRCYIDTLPRILIVCERDIEEGEEILTSYGEEYCKVWIKNAEEAAAVSKATEAHTVAPAAVVIAVPVPGAGAVHAVKEKVPDSIYSHCEVAPEMASVPQSEVVLENLIV